MNEVELKILQINVVVVTKQLLELGAEQVFSGLVKSTFFDTPERTLKKTNKLLRLRTVGNEVELTVKEPVVGETQCKVRKEYQVRVDSFHQACAAVRALGYEQVKYHEKRRTSFVCGEVHCEIDEYPAIPPYLEIEGKTEEAVLAFLDQLGFARSEAKDLTATQVLKHYLGEVQDVRFQA